MDEQWMTALRTSQLRPTSEATTAIRSGVRRRRRTRAAALVTGSAAVVAAVAVGASVLASPGPDTPPAGPAPAQDPVRPGFSCPTEHPVFTEEPPDGTRALPQVTLRPILHEARRQTRGLTGLAGFAFWDDAGAIAVQWKQPVPEKVRALEDIRFKSGGRIFVWEVRYSDADVRRAQDLLQDWLVSTGHRDDWSSASACGDHSGLVVGMTPESLEQASVSALQDSIADAIGMPALVVPERRPVQLDRPLRVEE